MVMLVKAPPPVNVGINGIVGRVGNIGNVGLT